jgi:hypothetical protein
LGIMKFGLVSGRAAVLQRKLLREGLRMFIIHARRLVNETRGTSRNDIQEFAERKANVSVTFFSAKARTGSKWQLPHIRKSVFWDSTVPRRILFLAIRA